MKHKRRAGSKGFRSIRTRLIAYFSIMLLIATMALGFTALNKASTSLKNEAKKALVSLAEEGAQITSSRIDGQIKVLKTVAATTEIESMDWRLQQPELQRVLDETGFLDMAVVLPDGSARYTSGDTSSLGDREYVKKAFMGEANVSDLLISRVTNAIVLMYATPIYQEDKVVGVLIGRRDGHALSNITNDITYGETGYSYMFNSKGIVVAHPDENKVLNQFNPIEEYKTDESLKSLAESFERGIRDKHGNMTYRFNGKDIMTGYAPVEGTDWVFSIAAEQHEVLEAIPGFRNSLTYMVLITIICCIAVVYVIGSGLIKPVTKVVDQSKRIAALDITGNIQQKYLGKKDEVGDLSRALQEITDNLRVILKEITDSSDKVAIASNELTNTSQQLAVSAEEVALTVGEVAHGASEQAKDLEIGFEKATVLGDTIEKDQVYIQKLNTATQKVTDAVSEGLEVIEGLSQITDENNAASKEVYDVILQTNQSSNKIGEASTMISSIAKQTNLLALNASIEASRAGEAGKGFAVVAEEIRKLAELSAASTREIDEMVGELLGNSTNAMDTIKKVTTITVRQTESVKNTREKYQLIHKAMIEAEKAVQQMNVSGAEMERMKNEILATLENLSAIAEENSASTEEMSASIEEQSASVEEMASASDGLSAMAAQLQRIIDRFKL